MQELAARAHAVMAADSSRKGLEYRDVGELWDIGGAGGNQPGVLALLAPSLLPHAA